MIKSLCLYLHCLSAALLCYTGFQNQSLIRSTSSSCSTCCFGLGFQLQNLQDFIKISRALIKDIFLTPLTTVAGHHYPGDGPPALPRHTAPTGHAGQGDSVGPPHPHTRARSTWVADPNSPPSGRAVGGGGAPDLRRPSQQWQATHPRGRPPTTPAARSPHRACRPSQIGGNGDQTAPPQDRQTEQGTGAGHAEGHGPRGTALPAPSAGTARGAQATPPRGGGSGRRGSASAHTHKGHAGTTRRATRPSSQNVQTAPNGVPASEGKGHQDGTARHTQRGTRGAGRGKRERHNTKYRPEPPEPAASAAHKRTGHCTRQGSSGALRHAPAPRLGSLRASPRGSHWRQASSTDPVAPAPLATTH